MNFWIHLLIGAIFSDLFYGIWGVSVPVGCWMAGAVFISHFVLDLFNNFFYHPHTQGWKKWPAQQIFVMLASAFIYIYFTFFFIGPTNFKWFRSFFSPDCYFAAFFFSTLPDMIDWGVIRFLIHFKKIDQKWWDEGIFHGIVNRIKEKYLPRLPDWRDNKKTFILELILMAGLVIIFLYVRNWRI